jgi:hypothetical protein
VKDSFPPFDCEGLYIYKLGISIFFAAVIYLQLQLFYPKGHLCFHANFYFWWWLFIDCISIFPYQFCLSSSHIWSYVFFLSPWSFSHPNLFSSTSVQSVPSFFCSWYKMKVDGSQFMLVCTNFRIFRDLLAHGGSAYFNGYYFSSQFHVSSTFSYFWFCLWIESIKIKLGNLLGHVWKKVLPQILFRCGLLDRPWRFTSQMWKKLWEKVYMFNEQKDSKLLKLCAARLQICDLVCESSTVWRLNNLFVGCRCGLPINETFSVKVFFGLYVYLLSNWNLPQKAT